MSTVFSFLLLLFNISATVWSYEAPEEKEDVFARRACPAFLTFTNAAYLSGATVELPCLCKPQQVQFVVWFFRKHSSGPEETKVLTDHHGNQLLESSLDPQSDDLRNRFSIRLFSLIIFRATPDNSGLYICGSTHKDFFYAYDLDIQEAPTYSFISSKQRTLRRSSSPKSLFQIFTSFRPWSKCDRCGLPGEQIRAGLCYVQSQYLHVRFRRTNQTAVSCGSGAVPKAFGPLKERGRTKLEVRGCEVTCPTEAPPPSRLVALKAFLGRSSASSLDVSVLYLNHPADQVLTLTCPGAHSDKVVAWDQGSKPLYRSEHTADTRVHIDTGSHLVFKPAQTQDSGTYFCWLQGRKRFEIRLLVYVKLGRGESITSHPDFYPTLNTLFKSYAAMTAAFCLLLFLRATVRHLRGITDAHQD